MQTVHHDQTVPFAPSAFPQNTVRQRLLSTTLSIAMTGSASTAGALAYTPAPFTPTVSPLTHTSAGATAIHSWQAPHTTVTHSNLTNPLALSPVHGIVPFALSTTLHPITTQATSHSNQTSVTSTAPGFASQATGTQDVNLASSSALFSAGSLAGFHTITLDIGGKSQTISFDSKLTGAELVAAQQVLSGGKQLLTINAKGVATGGVFDINSTTVSQLDSAVGGTINTLDISHGVVAVDTLSSLTLSGALINSGTIDLGAASAAKSQTIDTISAANIYNASGATIASAVAVGGVKGTGITLSTPGSLVNSGTINSTSTLNVSAGSVSNTATTDGSATATGTKVAVPQLSATQDVNLSTSSLTNSGLISSAKGNVNIVNNSTTSDLNVVNNGGTVQAVKGNINFNAADYAGSNNINVTGGNWLSQQLNFNAGTGGINANVDEVTGVVNGTAGSSHVTAATGDLQLGNIDVSGDPTYFNQGDITITGALTGDPDLAIVASGNIIANGGSLMTDGGNLTLIAGAAFTPSSGGTGSTATAGAGDTTTTVTVTGASSTGGYIDMSGSGLTGIKSNQPIAAVDTSNSKGTGGNILMVAYAGNGANSGSIYATSLSTTSGAQSITAAGATLGQSGSVTLIGGGNSGSSAIFANQIVGGVINVIGGTPTLTGSSLVITDGKITSGSYDLLGTIANPQANYVFLDSVVGSSILVSTGGYVSTGDLIAPGGVSVATPYLIEVGNIIASGAGGLAGAAGQNGGQVLLEGGEVIVNGVIDTSGGGGGGGNAGAAGGVGGNGGAITLLADAGVVAVEVYINASGGGGGGGGGSNSAAAGGAGGVGGSAGVINIQSAGTIVASAIYDYDGGAGGKGTAATVGVAGGGGGGGGGSYGGGGGGGAAGINGAGTAVGGGGGGGLAPGGGGGGTIGTMTVAVGGTGGSQFGSTGPTPGLGGLGNLSGSDGAYPMSGNPFSVGGAGGNYTTGATNNGAGGINFQGGKGGQSGSSGTEFDGGNATTTGSSGNVTLSFGASVGTKAAPLEVDTASLTIVSSGDKNVSFYGITGADSTNLQSQVAFGAGSTFSFVSSTAYNPGMAAGVIDVSTPLSAPTLVLTSSGDLTTSGTGSISGTTATLTSGGNIDVATALNSLAFSASGNTVTINESASAGGSLTITKAGIVTGSTLSITSAQALNITPALNAGLGTIDLKTTGATSNITTSGLLTASNLDITASAGVGTSAKPLSSNVSGIITVVGNSANPIYLKDANAGTLLLNGNSNNSGQSITVTSAAATLNVENLHFSNVTLTDTSASTSKTAGVFLNSNGIAGDTVGDGTGSVTIKTNTVSINGNAANPNTVVLNAVAANISSTAGDVGPLAITASSLTASAPKGSLSINDTEGVSLGAGSAASVYQVTSASTGPLVVGGLITAPTINLTSTSSAIDIEASIGSTKTTNLNLTAGNGIDEGASGKPVLTGGSITLQLTGNGDIGSSAQAIVTKASSVLTVLGAAGYTDFVNQTGNVSLGSQTNTAGQLTLNSTGTITVPMGNTIKYVALYLTTPSLVVNGNINAQTLSVGSPGALSITGSGTIATPIFLTLGGTSGSKTTTSITLGAPKTGAGNPLLSALGGGVTYLTILTKGNFTSNLGTTPTISTLAGGYLSITAANIVAVSPSSATTPVILASNTTGAGSGGEVSLNLTGTQAVTLSNTATSKAPAPYEIEAKGTTVGAISVTTAGNLTDSPGGLSFGTSTGNYLTLSSGKNLADSANDLATGLNTLTLVSKGTTPFTVNTGAPVTTAGTTGDIAASVVNITSGGNIVVNSGGTITATTASTFANPTGALNISGAGTITPGSSLTLTAKSGVTAGAPLANIGNDVLSNFTVNTGGNFSYSFANNNTFALKSTSTSDGLISITAGNVVNLNTSTALQPIVLDAVTDGTSSTLNLSLTGTQSVAVGTATVTKGTPNFTLKAQGASGNGTITVGAAGALSVTNGGITLTGNNNNLSLSGAKGLAVNATGLTESSTNLNNLTLSSGSATPFVIGTATPTNGTSGNLQALAISVTDIKGVTVNTGATVTSDAANGSVTFDTGSLLNNGTVAGFNNTSTLAFSDPGKNNLGVAIGSGTFTNGSFGIVKFSTLGNVNLGNLFTSGTTLNSGLSSISITGGGTGISTGSVTFASALPVLDASNITINAASLVTKATTPITLGTGDAITVSLTDKAALTLGTMKGMVDIDTSGASVANIASSGTLTVGDNLTIGSGSLSGSAVVIGKNFVVDASAGNLSVVATGKTGTITEGNTASEIKASGVLTLGQGSTALAKTPLQVSAPTLVVGALNGQGALNINDVDAAAISVSGSGASPISSLILTTAGATSTTVGSITTTAGGISITANLGPLSTSANSIIQSTGGGITLLMEAPSGTTLTVGNNSQLRSSSGSILLENRNTSSGAIDIGTGVTIYASGTKAGVGQVSIVLGAVPTSGLQTTPAPTGTAPVVNVNGGANVYYGVTGTSTAIKSTGTNTLNAFGRNIVFNAGSSSNTITLSGNDTITADPPVSSASSAGVPISAVQTVVPASTSPISTLSPGASAYLGVNSGLTSPIAGSGVGQLVTGNSAMAGISGLNAVSAGALTGASGAALAGLTSSGNNIVAGSSTSPSSNGSTINTVDSGNQTINGSRSIDAQPNVSASAANKKLSGKISNVDSRSLSDGPLLISPNVATVVQTDFGSVAVAAKSVALIVAFEGGVAVYNLHDSHKDAVMLNYRGHSVSLAPGQNAVMTSRQVRFFEEINPAQRVAYRRMTAKDFGDGVKSFRSEFNLISLLQAYEPLKQFVNSEDSEARKASQAMLKTAAIMMGIGGSEPFELMVARPVTAMNAPGAGH